MALEACNQSNGPEPPEDVLVPLVFMFHIYLGENIFWSCIHLASGQRYMVPSTLAICGTRISERGRARSQHHRGGLTLGSGARHLRAPRSDLSSPKGIENNKGSSLLLTLDLGDEFWIHLTPSTIHDSDLRREEYVKVVRERRTCRGRNRRAILICDAFTLSCSSRKRNLELFHRVCL